MSNFNPYMTAIFFPLLGFIVVGLFGTLLQRRLSGMIATALMAGAALSGWTLFIQVLQGRLQPVTYHLFQWIKVGAFEASWQLYFDSLTVTMIMVVTTVSFLVHLYSIGYMAQDKSVPRFMAYLSLFTFTMLMLVTSSNLIQLFFGWEGVGLASYLLIGFWHHKDSANAASMKAFIVNRVGDVGLALGIAAIYMTFHTVEINQILAHPDTAVGLTFQVGAYEVSRLEVIGILLFIGAMGKSAQLGLHTWLPDAMEGPTPVSALIHAATMVTAGVFLVARLSGLYELAPYAKNLIVIVGASTAFFAGTIALTQNDIKRVIAYSTCSQLGYMFFVAGLGAYHLAIFHLVTHACFKALLFLGAGAVIHALSDEQDMRKMGGVWRAIPATYAMMWIGSLALAGIPLFAGYYSKDAILNVAWLSSGLSAHYAYILGIGAAFLTALYSWRLLFMTFHGPSRADEKVLSHIHEPGATMLIPLCVLSLGAICSGFILTDYFTASTFWQDALVFMAHGPEHVPAIIHYLPLLMGVIAIGLAYRLYLVNPKIPDLLAARFLKLYTFIHNKWYFDELYHCCLVKPAQKIGEIFWLKGDKQTIDGYGPDGIAAQALRVSSQISQAQTGYVYHYALATAVGFLGLLFWLWF